jgi:hypothetical protein
MSDQSNLLELVAQYAQLDARIRPLLPQISAKLVGDLLATGVEAKKLGKVLGKSPSYVTAIGNGAKSLSAEQIIAVLRYVANSNKDQNDA